VHLEQRLVDRAAADEVPDAHRLRLSKAVDSCLKLAMASGIVPERRKQNLRSRSESDVGRFFTQFLLIFGFSRDAIDREREREREKETYQKLSTTIAVGLEREQAAVEINHMCQQHKE